MSNIQLPDPDRDQNPHQTYDRITGSVIMRSDGWHAVIRKWHSQTGVERYEESKMRWSKEENAKAAVEKVVNTMRERLAG